MPLPVCTEAGVYIIFSTEYLSSEYSKVKLGKKKQFLLNNKDRIEVRNCLNLNKADFYSKSTTGKTSQICLSLSLFGCMIYFSPLICINILHNITREVKVVPNNSLSQTNSKDLCTNMKCLL